MGLKWASQLITQIWRLIYRKWLQQSKINHKREALDNHTKELILDADKTDGHEKVQGTLTDLYNSYFGTPLFIILDTLITAKTNW